MTASDKDRAQEVKSLKTASHSWMQNSFYPSWERTYKNYLCERDPEADDNDPTKPDTTKTSLGMPDTWGYIRRFTARATAQMPSPRMRDDDPEIAEFVSRGLMYAWDRAKIQRSQKRHVLQAGIFGWSPRAWYWRRDEFLRKKMVNMASAMEPIELSATLDFYKQDIQSMAGMIDPQDPAAETKVVAELLKKYGKGNLLPVRYPYVSYEGPGCDFLFVGDCYPEPNFQSIQGSKRFIVERRRDEEWLDRMAEAYPQLAKGIQAMLEKHPHGTQVKFFGDIESGRLRRTLMDVSGIKDQYSTYSDAYGTGKWTVTEMHTKTRDGNEITYVGEDDQYLGTIPYPYDLDGKLAFTELVFVDNLLCGIGDSAARMLKGIQELHNRIVSRRADLIDRAMRPNVFTSDRSLAENPERLKSVGGMRLIYARGGSNAVQWENIAPALASIMASSNDESNIQRMIQVGTGDSNMSMAANVDPSQARTATGARIMAFNADVLTKDVLDMLNFSLVEDCEMMFALYRSELGDDSNAPKFDASLYSRANSMQLKQKWVSLERYLFERDGNIEVELGSTLADDDEAKMQKSSQLGQFAGSPFVDQLELTKRMLSPLLKPDEIRMMVKPPEPPPPPPDESKLNGSVSLDYKELPEQIQGLVLQKLKILPPPPQPPPGPPGAPPPSGPGGPPQGPPPPPQNEPPPDVAAQSLAAGMGQNPFGQNLSR